MLSIGFLCIYHPYLSSELFYLSTFVISSFLCNLHSYRGFMFLFLFCPVFHFPHSKPLHCTFVCCLRVSSAFHFTLCSLKLPSIIVFASRHVLLLQTLLIFSINECFLYSRYSSHALLKQMSHRSVMFYFHCRFMSFSHCLNTTHIPLAEIHIHIYARRRRGSRYITYYWRGGRGRVKGREGL